jgi:hypothetical protein
VHPHLARDHDPVEELRERRAVVAPGAERVRDQAGPDPERLGPADGGDHGLVGPHPGEKPIDQPVGIGDAEEAAEADAELVLGDRARLDLAQRRPGVLVVAHQRQERAGVEPLGLAEASKRLEDVRSQHAAVVDE